MSKCDKHRWQIYYVGDWGECVNIECDCDESLPVDQAETMLNRENETQVEDCANWLEISMVQGGHCYNCASRDGYPWRARPSKGCAKFALLTAKEKK